MRVRRFIAACLLILSAPAAAEDVLRVGAQAFPQNFGNPYGPIALPMALAVQALFDPLTVVGPNGQVRPALAVSWDQESPTTWVFRLREGVTFSNGEPFDASAVVATLDHLLTDVGRRTTVASIDMKEVLASYQARDPLTLEIVTKTPDPILPLHLTFMRIPAPKRWAELGQTAFQLSPSGTGPFMAERWTEARLDMVANRHSWRPPQVDRVQMLQISDPTVRLQAFVSGQLDIATALAPQDDAAVASVGGRLLGRTRPIVHFLLFVTEKDTPLSNLLVQHALNYAANKEILLTAFLSDAVSAESQFAHPMAFGYNPGLAPYPYDPDKARALLAEAGYGDGFSFTMLLDPSSGGNYTDWFQQLAQDFGKVGVNMTIRMTNTARLIESVQTGNWAAGDAFAWTFAGFDALRGYRMRSCDLPSAYNCDPEIMPLIEAANAATTEAERQAATQAALAFERDRPPGVMLWQGVDFDGIAGRVKNYTVEQDLVRWDLIGLK